MVWVFLVLSVLGSVRLAAAEGDHLFHGASGLPHGVPDFCANASNVAQRSGNWSDAQIWSAGHAPSDGERVAVGTGATVIYDADGTAALPCVDVVGTLQFRTDVATTLRVGTLMVKPGGVLEIGTPAAPVAPEVTAQIVFLNAPLDTTADPEQYATGLIGFGTVHVHGAAKTPTFVRLAQEPLRGQTTLVMSEAPQGWRVGDRVVIPDTRQLRYNETGLQGSTLVPQWETLVISAINDKSITVTTPLRFDHRGARSSITGTLDFLPHVMNMSRNVILKSENPAGVRGHGLFSQRADVDIRFAEFTQMGRTTVKPLSSTTFGTNGAVTKVGTNQIGRYPIHMHHLMGPQGIKGRPSFTLLGNSIEDTTKWAITLHNSHYGLVESNVIFKSNGAGLMTEDGSESYNVIKHNMVVGSFGTGGRLGEGREGSGFWFRGVNNYVTDNVAANIMSDSFDSAYGYKYVLYFLGNVRIPRFQGADTTVNSNVIVKNANAMPILEFARNEVYGATESGLTYWWIGAWDIKPLATQWSVFKDLRVWNVHNRGIFHYPSGKVRVDGMVMRSTNPGSTSACCQVGIDFGDYFGSNFVLANSDIEGRMVGLLGSPKTGGTTLTVENSTIAARLGLGLTLHWHIGARADQFNPRRTIVRNVKFVALLGPSRAIGYNYAEGVGRSLVTRDEILVFNYNGVSGDNFQVYYPQQAATFVVPKTRLNTDGSPSMLASPEAGLTNQQNWAKYHIAIAGAIAPCGATRTGITGFACPVTTPLPSAPPSSPTNVRVVSN